MQILRGDGRGVLAFLRVQLQRNLDEEGGKYTIPEFCWQTILEFPQHLTMTHMELDNALWPALPIQLCLGLEVEPMWRYLGQLSQYDP